MGISAATEQRVRQAARELNYRPNLLSRGLKSSHATRTLGLISDVVASEMFAGEMIRGALATAALNNNLLFVAETQGAVDIERKLVDDMLDRGVNGFIYASMYTRRVRISRALRSHPLVLLNCINRDRRIPIVIPDERQAGRDVAQLLITHGHRRIALVGEVSPLIHAATERLAGIEEILTEHDIALTHQVSTLWWPQPAREATQRFLAAGHRPTAIICLNDRVAMGVYQAAATYRLTIPADLSVISFDNSDLATWLNPGLTSAALPHFEMGRRAVETLLAPTTDQDPQMVATPVLQRQSIATL